MEGESSNSVSFAPTASDRGVSVFNKVERTMSGHQFETSDVMGDERLKWSHTKGTYEEWDSRGGRTLNVNGDNYTAIIGENEIVVTGACKVVVNGACDLTVTKPCRAQFDDSLELSVRKNFLLKTDGWFHVESKGDIAFNSGMGYRLIVEDDAVERFKGKLDTNINDTHDLTVGNNQHVTITGNHVQTTTAGTFIISSTTMTLGANSDMNLATAAALNVNSASTTTFNSSEWIVASGPATIKPTLGVEGAVIHYSTFNQKGAQTNDSSLNVSGLITSSSDVISQKSLNNTDYNSIG